MKDVIGSIITAVLVVTTLSFVFEYVDPVTSIDSDEQMVADNTR